MNLNAAKLIFVLGPLLIMFSSNCSLPFNSRQYCALFEQEDFADGMEEVEFIPSPSPQQSPSVSIPTDGTGYVVT